MLESVIFTDADIQELNDGVFFSYFDFFSYFEFYFCNITIRKNARKNTHKNSFVMKYTNVNKNQFASGVDGKKALK